MSLNAFFRLRAERNNFTRWSSMKKSRRVCIVKWEIVSWFSDDKNSVLTKYVRGGHSALTQCSYMGTILLLWPEKLEKPETFFLSLNARKMETKPEKLHWKSPRMQSVVSSNWHWRGKWNKTTMKFTNIFEQTAHYSTPWRSIDSKIVFIWSWNACDRKSTPFETSMCFCVYQDLTKLSKIIWPEIV